VADLEVIVAWFLSLKETLQERVFFVPNMLSNTKEQRSGVKEIETIILEENRGKLLSRLRERKAVYPKLPNNKVENYQNFVKFQTIKFHLLAVLPNKNHRKN
jgi:hypothetical protein